MLKQNENLKPRDIYLNQLIAFQDTEPVKVVTKTVKFLKATLVEHGV